ncbi:hypothetical protein Y032_0154g2948 [Ancylostoma ceylanicum]|uniref:C2H2-type domain-containing protein n=1 Tax=Ancylostoma ceylanicum TaxID=53326 RepID=A0A016SZS3_9BILA|nr:hypothetical protein Y032_0154g2948 [Ancylostoma ceylanicum]
MCHLISECYMAPCPICGDKLNRRNDRVTHRKMHKDVFERFMCECRRGFSHYPAFTEHQCRTRTLPTVTCSACDRKFVGSVNGGRAKTVEENMCNGLHSFPNGKRRSKRVCASGSGLDQDAVETTDASDADSAPSLSLEEIPAEDDVLHMDILQESQLDDFQPSEGSNSRDASSPSVLEKQRQVLAGLLDDLGPPPSVIIIENEAAVIREEREEPQSMVPKSSVADDGEDDILVIDETSGQSGTGRSQSPPPSMSSTSPVVHTVNEGDEDCMMLDVVELPTGSISHAVASTREKKYKCSMCSETFLRESTCRHHEQTSHRNDIVSDICDEVARIAVPTLCSHRTFITFGDAFTTCPEDPSRCFGLVNQNRWHSYLCATNRENPGEMPTSMPEGVVVRNVYSENMIDMLLSRFRISENNRGITLTFTGSPSRPSNNGPPVLAPYRHSIPSEELEQNGNISTCEIANRRRGSAADGSQVLSAPILVPSQQVYVNQTGGDMPALRQTLSNTPIPHTQSQTACIFCRCRNVPVICEPSHRAYEAVNSLCTKFREVHPIAAQTLFSALNSFIRETINRRHGRALFCFCRWHYSPQCFDASGQHVANLLPTHLNSSLLLSNYQKGLFYPDPASVTILTPVPLPSTTCRPVVSGSGSANPPTQSVIQRCVVCDIIAPTGLCRATSFCADYMVAVPLVPANMKEQWANHICRSVTGSKAQELLNAFRSSHSHRLCIRHFNPRTMVINPSGVLVKNPSSVTELPLLDFSQYAMLNAEFSQAFSKLLDAMEKRQNSNTIAMMLKIVQELVKCNDEKCSRPLNSCNDVRFHRFHDLQHKYVCMECFSTTDVIRTEQEMIEHFVSKHSQRSPGDTSIPVVYSLHCPLRNCSAAFPSVQTLRKHINHVHANQFPCSSDNCATRFFNSAKMVFHNGVHEKHSCDVTCCYLCGVADPWQREVNGVRVSHELVHGMRRFIACKTCMAPMGQDPTGVMLIDHFMRHHMLDQPKRVRHCKVCRQNVIEPGIAEHILEQHRLIAFRARYAPQSNMVSVMNGSEFCVYLGIPPDLCKPNPLADSSELG